MIDDWLRDEINKRLTLNWLIQGAAQHAGMTLHHLVRDGLDAIDPSLVRLYDQYALINLLQYWHFEGVLIMGRPTAFWRRAASKRRHPFFGHPLLSRHGGALAAAAKQRALERSKEKGVTRIPVLFALQVASVMGRLTWIERNHRRELIDLAKSAASTAWGIPTNRFDAELTPNAASTTAFEKLPPPRSLRGVILRSAVNGYGGVVRRDASLTVVARAANWQVLTKELVKGTAELICLHGLSNLSDATYQRVMHAADRIEYEPWMLQTGGELWRRLLAVIPDDRPVSELLMHLARLPAKSLESLMLAVLEQPEWARELLADLGRAPAG